MSNEQAIFSKALEEEFFLKGEYLKRHFEDNADIQEINWLKDNCFEPSELTGLADSDKIIIVRECICKRDKETRGEEYIPSLEIPFRTEKKRKWIEKLHKMSKKYKVYAPELMFNYDFVDIMQKVDSHSNIPTTRLFEDEPDYKYIYQQYGYTATTKGDGRIKNLILEIHFSDEHEQQSDIIQRISSEIAIFKKTNNIEINAADIEYLKLTSSQDKSKKYRLNAMYNRAIGIYAWDMLKEHKITLEEARQRLIKTGLYRYNKKRCNISSCTSCESKENCCDAFEQNYRIAATSISMQTIIPTSQKIEKTIPKREGLVFQRIPADYFQ